MEAGVEEPEIRKRNKAEFVIGLNSKLTSCDCPRRRRTKVGVALGPALWLNNFPGSYGVDGLGLEPRNANGSVPAAAPAAMIPAKLPPVAAAAPAASATVTIGAAAPSGKQTLKKPLRFGSVLPATP